MLQTCGNYFIPQLDNCGIKWLDYNILSSAPYAISPNTPQTAWHTLSEGLNFTQMCFILTHNQINFYMATVFENNASMFLFSFFIIYVINIGH